MKKILVFIFCLTVLGFSAQKINTTLQYLVNQPAQKTAKPPVLILLHGYGSNEEDLFDISKALDPRFMTFSVRGAYNAKDVGYCWYKLEFVKASDFVYDYQQAQESRNKLLSFISNACKTYKLDSTQVYLMGFSQGAIMSYEIAAYAPSKIKGVLALSGRMMEETKQLKTDWSKVAKVKFFIGHGYSDNIINIIEAGKAASFLKEKQVTDLTSKNYEMPHTISGAELNDIKAWLTRSLEPEKKPAPQKK